MFCLGTFLCTTHVAVSVAITKSKRPCNQETYHCQCQGAHYQTPSKWSLYCTYVALGVPEYTHTSFRHMRGRKTRLAPHMFFGCQKTYADQNTQLLKICNVSRSLCLHPGRNKAPIFGMYLFLVSRPGRHVAGHALLDRGRRCGAPLFLS